MLYKVPDCLTPQTESSLIKLRHISMSPNVEISEGKLRKSLPPPKNKNHPTKKNCEAILKRAKALISS